MPLTLLLPVISETDQPFSVDGPGWQCRVWAGDVACGVESVWASAQRFEGTKAIESRVRLEPLCQGLMGTSTAAIDWIEITGRLQRSSVGPQPAVLTEISACIVHHRLGPSECVERSVDLSDLPRTAGFTPDTP